MHEAATIIEITAVDDMTNRYQRAKRLHTWICAGIAMAVYGGFIFLIGVADFISQF